MTLQDLIDFLLDEAHRQTLTEQEVRRCLELPWNVSTMILGIVLRMSDGPQIPNNNKIVGATDT